MANLQALALQWPITELVMKIARLTRQTIVKDSRKVASSLSVDMSATETKVIVNASPAQKNTVSKEMEERRCSLKIWLAMVRTLRWAGK